MTACLPDDPVYCFYPAIDEDGEPPRILILVEAEDLAFAIPAMLVRLTADDGFMPCDRLNKALGLDRAVWLALAARCLRVGSGGMNGSTALH